VLTLALMQDAHVAARLLVIVLAAIAAHIAVVLVRVSSAWLLGSRVGSITKARTFTRFITSVAGFVIWFIAVGFAFSELGIPLQTYLASATIIGLAVSFGSQSLVQDVISGVTLIFTGLINVGDMVEIGGQNGVVEKIGIRYTELRNVQGAQVFIPNRNVANVINYPVGYIRAFVDVRLPIDATLRGRATSELDHISRAAYDQFTGIMPRPPSLITVPLPGTEEAPGPPFSGGETRATTTGPGAAHFARIKFRIWPGQGLLIETTVRQRILGTMRALDPEYQDWMVAVHYRVEPAFQRRAVSALDLLRQRRQQPRGK
jgi:moderate conductance mechanosensitive channel